MRNCHTSSDTLEAGQSDFDNEMDRRRICLDTELFSSNGGDNFIKLTITIKVWEFITIGEWGQSQIWDRNAI